VGSRRILYTVPKRAGRPVQLLQRLEEAGFVVEQIPEDRHLTEAELIARIPGIVAMIAAGEPYTERVFTAASDLRLVSRYGVGCDNVDLAAATRHRVAVTRTSETNSEAVADLTLSLMCAARRQLLQNDRAVRRGRWLPECVPGLWRATVGIVGFGRIGRRVAKRCLGFDMRVLATKRRPEPEFTQRYGVELVSMDELFRQADIVTLHVPASPENIHLVNRQRLTMMKPTAILINTARGDLVDEAALCEALRAGTIAGAGLDVFAREPPIDSPLFGLDNVVLTPHCAEFDQSSALATMARAVDTVLRFFRGESLPFPEDLLNPEVLVGTSREL
jgi:D-3-phosphoglycerate dehydrogenase / 2-oxoglutarate reductase